MGQKIRAAPAAPAPITNRRYGALTPAAPRDRELSFDHVTVPEQGYRSLASKAEVPLSGGGARGLTHILRRVVVGAVFITLSAAAVSTLYGGRASSKSGVGEAGVGYPEMTAEVSANIVLCVRACSSLFVFVCAFDLQGCVLSTVSRRSEININRTYIWRWRRNRRVGSKVCRLHR